MTGVKNILYGWMATLMLGCCALFVVSCSSDDPEPEQEQEQGDILQLVSCTRSDDKLITPGSEIRMFITSATTSGDTPGRAVFVRNASESAPFWTTGGKIEENAEYYLYGVLSGDGSINTEIEPKSDDYSLGATLTIRGLSPLALEGQDPCVIVGVKGTTNNVTLGDNEVERGQFYYKGQAKDQNFVHLLLERLYSAITFKFDPLEPLDEDYASLRTIKLTKLQLKVSLGSGSKMDMTVPLTANNDKSSPVGTIVSQITGSTTAVTPITLFEDTNGGKELSTIQPSDIKVGCFAPGFTGDDNNKLYVVSYYDVYDKQGYKLSSRTAENALDDIIESKNLGRGNKLTLTLTVNPTYLYQLSDPDATTVTIKK